MAKIRASATEIKAEIDRRIAAAEESWAHCRDCRVSTPRPVPLGKARYHGANWIPEFIESPVTGCETFVHRMINDVMRDYDCSDW